jgi:hypothetical protein
MTANMMPAKTTETWSVAVVYENTEMRQRAMQVCDHLIHRFWSEIEFDLKWWRFDFLQDEVLSQRAASQVSVADVVIVAAAVEGKLPAGVGAWLERSLSRREEREGMFIALLGAGDNPFHRPDVSMDAVLRRLAHRAGMDYFTEAPAALPGSLPDSLENYSQRAEEHTTIIESILKHAPRPPLLL